jgi:lipopolysaccharide assembly outer membrane protein LptD (OstA)
MKTPKILTILITFSFMLLLLVLSGLQCTALAEEQKVKLHADRMVYNQNNNEISLFGNVRFIHGNAVLTGDRAVFNNSKKQGHIRGGVKITQPGTTITADMVTVYYDKNRAELTGNVDFITNRVPTGGNLKNSPQTRIKAQKMVYNWTENSGTASGGVTVTQGGRRAKSNEAVYNGSTDIITLTGGVRFEQGSNDWVTAEKVVIDVKNETFMASGGVSGTFYVETPGDQKTAQPAVIPDKNPDKIPLPEFNFESKNSPE